MNPPDGAIVTANQRVIEADEPFISTLWEPPARAARIRERLEALRKLSPEDLLRIQLDRRPSSSRRVVEQLLPYLEPSAQEDPMKERALALLKAWTGELAEESAQAALYAVLYERLLINTFQDELGDLLLPEFFRAWNLAELLLDRFIEAGTSPWFDNAKTTEEEGLAQMATASFHEALSLLAARLGPDPARWRWGALHTLKLEHPLGKRASLDRLYNRGPFAMGGDTKSVWVSSYRHDGRFQGMVGPSFRLVVALGDPPSARAVIPGGQSGLPWSPFYDDQLPAWLRGDTHPCLIERREIEAQSSGRLRLLPKQPRQKT